MLVRILALVLLLIGLVAGVRYLSESSREEAEQKGREQAQREISAITGGINELNTDMAMLDPTVEKWRTADIMAQTRAVSTWAEAVEPNAPDEQVLNFQQCINQAADNAPSNALVRETIAAPCAASLGW